MGETVRVARRRGDRKAHRGPTNLVIQIRSTVKAALMMTRCYKTGCVREKERKRPAQHRGTDAGVVIRAWVRNRRAS